MNPKKPTVFGIEYANTHYMKILNSSADPVSDNPKGEATLAVERPIKICVVFDENSSAGNAEVLIKQVASNFACETQSFRFDELDQPAPGVSAAVDATATDILVLAVANDRRLPVRVRVWLGLFAGLRDKARPGALVVLFSKAVQTFGSEPSFLEYLALVAARGGLAFIPQQKSVAPEPVAGHASPKPRKPPQSSLTCPVRKACFFWSWN